MKHAEAMIGGRGGDSLRSRAEYILTHAREHNLDGRLYELAWFIERTTRAGRMTGSLASSKSNQLLTDAGNQPATNDPENRNI